MEGRGRGGLYLEPAVELVGEGEAVGRRWGLGSVVGDFLQAFPDGGGVAIRQLLLQPICVAMFSLLHCFSKSVLSPFEQITIPTMPGRHLLLPQPFKRRGEPGLVVVNKDKQGVYHTHTSYISMSLTC